MSSLNKSEKARFTRQLNIPGFNESKQLLLRKKSALVTRVGGLGGPAAIGLAMAGIGKLIIAHGSVLIEPDLNRQLLFGEEILGKKRAPAAKARLESLARFTEVVALDYEPDDEEALKLAREVDIVLACPPGWPERYRLNRACIKAGTPMIDAAMEGMEGTLSLIVPGKTGCLSCVVPENPPPPFEEFFPVLGSVSHVMGSLAATEAIKFLTDLGKPIIGQRLHADLSTMQFRTYKMPRNSKCSVCGN